MDDYVHFGDPQMLRMSLSVVVAKLSQTTYVLAVGYCGAWRNDPGKTTGVVAVLCFLHSW
jgi:hypothetical protein